MNLTSQYLVNPKIKYSYVKFNLCQYNLKKKKNKIRINKHREYFGVIPIEHRVFNVGNTFFKMIHCWNGIFKSGEDNNPKRPKKLELIEAPFLLGEVEVTQELYAKIKSKNPSFHKIIPTYYFGSLVDIGTSQHPVTDVTWYDALDFCNNLSNRLGLKPYYVLTNKDQRTSLRKNYYIHSADVKINSKANGFRLPTEKQWEYAAKGGIDVDFAMDIDGLLDDFAWYEEDERQSTPHQVKTKLPNTWGFYDMTGNVNEWCCNEKDETFQAVAKGGAYCENLKITQQHYVYQNKSTQSKLIGFRVALPYSKEPQISFYKLSTSNQMIL